MMKRIITLQTISLIILIVFVHEMQAQVSTPPLPPEAHNMNGNQSFGIPVFLEVNNQTIIVGSTFCFDATQAINVYDFTIEAGGDAQFIAGQSITFKPGVRIEAGAYLLASIAINNQYCTNPTPETVALDPENIGFNSQDQKHLFQVHISGRSIILNAHGSKQMWLKVFNIAGQVVLNQELTAEASTKIETNLTSGIYIIKVIYNTGTLRQKVIIH